MLIEIGNRVVGELREGVFRKKVRGSKHLYRVLDAWGLSHELVQRFLADNVEIRILDEETDTVYVTDAATYAEHGEIAQHYGFEKQVFLPRSFFETVQRQPTAIQVEVPPRQGRLFA